MTATEPTDDCRLTTAMERLWSPWRLAYVTGAVGAGTGATAAFSVTPVPSRAATISFSSAPRFPTSSSTSIPYNNGHLMVVPNRHVATLASSTADELSDLMRLTRHAEIALAEAYTPQGINVGINLGAPAGAGIVDHLHVHLVPRWTGDTSFISVVGNTRVLPEELPQTAARLRPIFERLAKRRRLTQSTRHAE